MKKIVAFMLVAAMLLSVTACGGKANTETTKDDTEGKTCVDILNDVWAAFPKNKQFAVSGGDYDHMVDGAAGAVDVTNVEVLDGFLGFPADSAGMIDEGACLIHMMNQNTFTAAVYHVTAADDVETVADAVKENILNRQWMCGFPDDLVVYRVGENFLAAAFGKEDNIDEFEDRLQEVFGSAVLLYDEDLNF